MDINIKEINLPELKDKVHNGTELSYQEIALIENILWGMASENEDSFDLIIVLGNPDCVAERLPKAIELLKSNPRAKLILCGGVAIGSGSETESEIMYNACLRQGINEDRLIIENRSVTTTENIIFAAEMITERRLTAGRIAVVTSPPHLRRAVMNLIKYRSLLPEDSSFFAVGCYMERYKDGRWAEDQKKRKFVGTELGFIDEYLYKLEFSDFIVKGV